MIRWTVTLVACIAGLGLEYAVRGAEPAALRWGGSVPAAVFAGVAAIGLATAALSWLHPWVGFAATCAVSLLIGWATPGWEPFAGILIALFILARCLDARSAWIALPVAAVPLSLNAWNAAGWYGELTPVSFLVPLAIWWLLAAAVWAAGRWAHRYLHRVEVLELSLDEIEARARETERHAIARDLHDIVAHAVSAITLQAAGAKALANAERPAPGSRAARVAAALATIEDTGAQAVRELHRLVRTMRGAEVARGGDPERLNGLSDIEPLLERTRGGGVGVTLTQYGSPRPLDPSVDVAAYRCVQESLTNAMKHAGPGSTVAIEVTWRAENLTIDILSGPTPSSRDHDAPPGSRLGLIGLSERMRALGGDLTVAVQSDGFRTTATLPAPRNSATRGTPSARPVASQS
ncbi:sensor histidine kinase [Microbacterium sp.]|uniref:sensor histidine kinase n=1 Tax=Microbacterium sp. TaxID=51671 RepID=UPI003A85F605